jgi:ABC-2 type transport system permease protein
MTRSDIRLAGRWIVARIKLNARNPRAMVFTFAFPLVLVVLFNGLNGNAQVAAPGEAHGTVPFAQFYTPSIGIFSLTTACYTAVILGLATAKESGLLKRVRGTPLPMGIYIGSWLGGAMATGIVGVILLFAVSIPAFGVKIYPEMLPAAIVTLLLGAACLAAVGTAVSTLVKTADQAMPVAQLTFLPISFISGIWFPLDDAPDWINKLAGIFPLKHIVETFDACFVPGTPNNGWNLDNLWSIVLWGAVATFVAVRRFNREAIGGGSTGRRTRSAQPNPAPAAPRY